MPTRQVWQKGKKLADLKKCNNPTMTDVRGGAVIINIKDSEPKVSTAKGYSREL